MGVKWYLTIPVYLPSLLVTLNILVICFYKSFELPIFLAPFLFYLFVFSYWFVGSF